MELALGQIIAQVLGFLLMLWILKKFAWKPILSILEERKLKIASDFAEIKNQEDVLKSMQQELREKMKALNATAEEHLNVELEKAKRMAEQIHKQAEVFAQEILDNAKLEMQQEVIKAKSSLKNEMVGLVITSTEKILKDKLKDEDVNRRFIEERLSQVK
ncbi:MAG: F0F1 ATP synthase subunit B [Parachlamydiaceae bacterium]